MKTLTFFLSSLLLGLSTSWLQSDSSYANQFSRKDSIGNHNPNSLISAVPSSEELVIRGNEPFWNITISRRGIVYTTPDTKKRTYPYIAPITALGRPDDLVRVYRLNGQPTGLIVLKKTNSCSDGMSDNVYPYEAILILGNQVMEGCAANK